MQKEAWSKKTTLKEDATIDTELDSPYNIYKNTGLMPGPVDNPEYQRLKRRWTQVRPITCIFVANVENGEVFFAKTYEEHNKKCWRTRQ